MTHASPWRPSAALCAALALWLGGGPAQAGPYPDRFVWVFGWSLQADPEIAEVATLLTNAAKSGFNGAVLSAGLDSLCKQSPDYFRRLAAVKAACDRLGLELIPAVFSAGYGGGALGHDRHLAEGLPVEDAAFVAGQGQARFEPDASVRLANGGFEEFDGHRMQGFDWHDQPGVVSFVETNAVRSGRAALRFENFTAQSAGNARLMQEVKLRPRRCYRVGLWVRTEALEPPGGFRVAVLAGEKNRELAPRTFNLQPTGGWRKLTLLFNSLDFDRVRLYAGVWGGRKGRFWLDDLSLEEIGPLNVLRRPGTPVTVRSENGATTYVEGRDFAPLEDGDFSFWNVDRSAPPLRLLPGSRIQEGQRLRVSWFHPMVIHDSQVSLCMAEPPLYRIWEHEARLLAAHLGPKRVLLNMDEVRLGGTCRACAGRDMAALLGECITRQTALLRRHMPGAQVYVWSDMLDPHHNARPDYYLVRGDYTGSWQHVPKDLVVAVWGGAPREKSLRFFADRGFQTLVACYYDAEDLNDVNGWLALARSTRGVRGFMYTPWEKKYELLPAFGALLKAEPARWSPTE